MKYGDLISDESHVHYIVQSKWPGHGDGPYHWGTYSPSAFNDKRKPNKVPRARDRSPEGTFDRRNMDVADHPSRVGRRVDWDWPVGPFDAAPVFTDPHAALAYAERLAKYGECSALYGTSGTEAGRRIVYAGAIRTRVVEERYHRYVRELTK